jgi:hypothetical protein
MSASTRWTCSVTQLGDGERRAFGGTWVWCGGGVATAGGGVVSLDDGVLVGGGLAGGAAGAQPANDRRSPRVLASFMASPVVLRPPRAPERESDLPRRAPCCQARQHATCRSANAPCPDVERKRDQRVELVLRERARDARANGPFERQQIGSQCDVDRLGERAGFSLDRGHGEPIDLRELSGRQLRVFRLQTSVGNLLLAQTFGCRRSA